VKIERVQFRGLLLLAIAMLLYLLYKIWSLELWSHRIDPY
jgi:hypothetical protein